jgi:hypothetical protein
MNILNILAFPIASRPAYYAFLPNNRRLHHSIETSVYLYEKIIIKIKEQRKLVIMLTRRYSISFSSALYCAAEVNVCMYNNFLFSGYIQTTLLVRCTINLLLQSALLCIFFSFLFCFLAIQFSFASVPFPLDFRLCKRI